MKTQLFAFAYYFYFYFFGKVKDFCVANNTETMLLAN